MRVAVRLRSATWVLLALAASACAKSDEDWRADLGSKDPYVRGLAAIGLGLQSPRAAAPALPILFETIDRSQTRLEAEAAHVLVLIGPEHIEALLDELVTNPLMTDQRRGAILNALANAGPKAAAPITRRLAGEGRAQAGDLGEVLLGIGAPAVPAIAGLLEAEGDPAPRRFAAFLLVKLGPQARAARPALERALASDDAELREVAEQALRGLGSAPRRAAGASPESRGPAGPR